MSYARKLILIGLALCLLYPLFFVVVFNVFSLPVRDSSGWIGPTKQVNPQVTDIGGVYFYNGSRSIAYDLYNPLCDIWLYINGVE